MRKSAENRSILLVDDIELFLELERTFFHRAGFDLLIAINAQEVMQLILRHQPDLVFLDTQLGGASGDDVCRWIKRDRQLQHIPVIMVVDAGDVEAESLCRQAGCEAILQRPVKRQQFLSIARQILDLPERQQVRVSARMPVCFGVDSVDEQQNYTVNISSGGVFIATRAVMPVGTELTLNFGLTEQQISLKCRGRVAWLNHSEGSKKPHLPTGMGIAFHSLSSAQQGLVSSFLNHQAA